MVMSLRTMPLSVSTLTPLEPSAGKGPAVSSGISAVSAEPAVSAAVVVSAEVVAAPAEVVASAEPLDEPPHPATTAARPPTAASCSTRRRVTSVDRSNDSPRS